MMPVEQKEDILKEDILDLDPIFFKISSFYVLRKTFYVNLFISKQLSYSQIAQQNLNEPYILSK